MVIVKEINEHLGVFLLSSDGVIYIVDSFNYEVKYTRSVLSWLISKPKERHVTVTNYTINGKTINESKPISHFHRIIENDRKRYLNMVRTLAKYKCGIVISPKSRRNETHSSGQ